jgi:hypothetical protein
MVDLTHVLEEKFKGMEWSLVGDCTTEEQFKNGFTITKANGFEEPTWAKLQEHLTSMQAAYDALDYSRKRKTAYDELNQLELMSDDSIGGTTTHKDAIIAIKKKYPKPE